MVVVVGSWVVEMAWHTPECGIKGAFLFMTGLYTIVTYRDTQDRSPSNPSYSEWDICWPIATWYISWHAAICFSVVSLPSRLFRLDLDGLAGYDIPQGPDWGRLTILFLWYLSGIPIAYVMQDSCSIGAPGTWARAFRVFIEGVVAFGLGGFIYSLGRWLFPNYNSRPILLPFAPEKVQSVPSSAVKAGVVEAV